jgi:hypothetical protein
MTMAQPSVSNAIQAAATAAAPPIPHDGYWPKDAFGLLSLVGGWTLLALVLAFGVTVLVLAWTKRFDVTDLISEPDPPNGTGKASLSRFQALIFTFVLAVGVLVYGADHQGYAGLAIPPELLWILAGSLGTYLTSKYISTRANQQANRPSGSDRAG